jgi:hypothetical protein
MQAADDFANDLRKEIRVQLIKIPKKVRRVPPAAPPPRASIAPPRPRRGAKRAETSRTFF